MSKAEKRKNLARQACIGAGWEACDLAKRWGCTREYVYMIWLGDRRPAAKRADLCELTGRQESDLWPGNTRKAA